MGIGKAENMGKLRSFMYMDEVLLNDYIGQFYVLCKVQSKIDKGKSIYLDELLEDIKKLPLNREQTRKMKKNELSNPKELSDQIKGPAIITLPIAIYR